jgi:hypothetical protein
MSIQIPGEFTTIYNKLLHQVGTFGHFDIYP